MFPVAVKPSSVPFKVITQIPLIKNYSKYTIYSSETIGYTFGCATSFAAPNYVFPSWDKQISQYPGISFGKITLNDFFTLETAVLITQQSPNTGLAC